MRLKRTREELGPNPDPEIWIDIKTKEGWLRRRRRKKKAKLNAEMQKYADGAKVAMPATARLLKKLEPWVRGMELGRVRVKLAARLKQSYLETGKMNFTYLKDVDIQPRTTLQALLEGKPLVKVNKEVTVKLLTSGDAIRVKKSRFTGYYFELIMVWGDVMPPNPLKGELKTRNTEKGGLTRKEYSGLRVDSVQSPVFPRETNEAGYYTMSIDVPQTKHPWMALLKVGCLEDKELASNPRHYAMKVMAVGGLI
jgi:hypothetical protein